MGQSASWCGSWQREGREVYKVRADSERVTLEIRGEFGAEPMSFCSRAWHQDDVWHHV